MTNDLVNTEKRGNVAIISISNPPVNALGAGVRQGIADAIDKAEQDAETAAIVLSGEGRCFCGGADITEFGHPVVDPSLPEVIAKIEACSKPVVAALHGVSFGGGLELPLGCHFRIADASALVALPEVTLGLIPGAGGTQRLPRLIGVDKALDMILSGSPVGAEEALALGIIDELVDGDLLEAAVVFAAARAADNSPLKRASELEAPPPQVGYFEERREKIKRRARGLIAPGHCITSVENAVTLRFAEGLKKERQLFVECRESEQSAAQRHIFFATRAAAKIPDVPKGVAIPAIRSAAVIGGGTMGVGIAMTFADAGIAVTIVETSDQTLENGLSRIKQTCAGSVKRGRITDTAMTSCLNRVKGTLDVADIKDADIVIEAVFEDMDLKKEIFATLDKVCKPGAILATNTSTMDIDAIAAATARPDKVIGTHFFSPAHIMRLMENVRGAKSSPETIASVMALSKKLGKVGVLVGNADGFVGNRMYHKYTRQAYFLLDEGALPEQVDKVLYDFGFAMGPFAVGDISGLDVAWAVRQRQAATRPADERYSPVADKVCEQGRFGQKTGAGWYRYEDGSRAPIPDPEIEKIIVAVSEELGIQRRDIKDEEIRERCLYALINEGAKILDEGLALRSGDIDVIWINGYGFPIHRGGPMFTADRLGVRKVYDAVSKLYDSHGDVFKPAALLETLAREGRNFRDI
ncbi:MAG: 3-hydroxyacyl-CoA dehydrogenase NAD-binding domain-containing protein [Proteobacteria bacterium]|nr:3-hydroxyacyl-CoA dehydrogenase NAD-binding domain-containing protein [Pseudomonadota bacterium]MDA1022749.1 3-hydroxyacyl-CoA dehydrogenase NAD-binding domain-containing protein [Pseudomonadota bacterium]